jgi:hypothetical protein
LTEGRQNKSAAGVWRPAAICLVKILSQPQVRANRAKPIKEILAAGCVVCLLAVHKAKVTGLEPLSSRMVAHGINPKAEFRNPKEVRSPKSEGQRTSSCATA